jgi:hypothetical protein
MTGEWAGGPDREREKGSARECVSVRVWMCVRERQRSDETSPRGFNLTLSSAPIDLLKVPVAVRGCACHSVPLTKVLAFPSPRYPCQRKFL